MNSVKSLYRQIRERGTTASQAIDRARRHLAGPMADYDAKLAAWKAEPDKRQYAPGGYANRPKYPYLYTTARIPAPVDGLRDCGFVDDIFPRKFNHEGWYADAFQDAKYRGQVWQLPAKDGQCRYIAGYIDQDSEYCVFCTYDDGTPEIFTGDNPGDQYGQSDALEDAARAADRLAERDAEREREYSEKWQEASRHDDERENVRSELSVARAEASATIAAWREQQKTGPLADSLCAMLRERVASARHDMRRALRKIETHTAAICKLGMESEF